VRKLAGIIRYTFLEVFRNKVYYVLVLFGAVLVMSTLLLGALGGEQKGRMIIDFGLAGIEAFTLVVAVFAAVTLVLEEMESRTLYLVLTRPVGRAQFILGRFFGLLSILTVSMAMMALAHVGLMHLAHVTPEPTYLLALYFSWEKIVVITAVAIFFSLFATSTVSAVSFTLFFWVLGHFSQEIRFLAEKSGKAAVIAVCDVFYYLAPNFHILNLRDFPASSGTGRWLWAAGGYGFCYAAAALALSAWIFRRKEF
jgi:ABC-type transport system involved in multi-copper enzyme maturation permease subunit